jgi:hypothetical protein
MEVSPFDDCVRKITASVRNCGNAFGSVAEPVEDIGCRGLGAQAIACGFEAPD